MSLLGISSRVELKYLPTAFRLDSRKGEAGSNLFHGRVSASSPVVLE